MFNLLKNKLELLKWGRDIILIVMSFIICYILADAVQYLKAPQLPAQTIIVEKGIVDMIEAEARLANKPVNINIGDVYEEEASRIENINGQIHEYNGKANIEREYQETPVVINQNEKFNYKVFYTKYAGKKPVEAIITYDIFIKYEIDKQVHYEYKTGKELMKAHYNKARNKWLIEYFYIQSA